MKHFTFFIAILYGCFLSIAQDLGGKWVIENAEPGIYSELNLVQNLGNQYAGHSYDEEKNGFCHHYLEATYDENSKKFIGRDIELINKSKTHEATSYNLKYEVGENGKEYLVGLQRLTPLRDKTMDFLSHNPFQQSFNTTTSESYVRYVKVSNQYQKVEDKFQLESKEQALSAELPETPSAPIIKVEPKSKQEELAVTNEPEVIIQKRKNRTDKTVAQIQAKSLKMTLLIRDYGTVDNDSLAIFFDNKLIKENLRIEQKAYEINLELKPNTTHELVFVAENLGDIPPNTARITLISDDKRFHYQLFTDDKFNAKIVIQTEDLKTTQVQ